MGTVSCLVADRPRFGRLSVRNCKALYQLVKAEAGPETIDRAVPCRCCGHLLPVCEGDFVLKYFLLLPAGRQFFLLKQKH